MACSRCDPVHGPGAVTAPARSWLARHREESLADRARVRLSPPGWLDVRDRAADDRGQPGQLPDDRAEGRARASAVHSALQGHRVLLDGPPETQAQGAAEG